MESQPRNPEFRNNLEKFHPYTSACNQGSGEPAICAGWPELLLLEHPKLEQRMKVQDKIRPLDSLESSAQRVQSLNNTPHYNTDLDIHVT